MIPEMFEFQVEQLVTELTVARHSRRQFVEAQATPCLVVVVERHRLRTRLLDGWLCNGV